MTPDTRKNKDKIVTTVILDRDIYTKFKLIVTCQETNIKQAIAALLVEYVQKNNHILEGMANQNNEIN